MKFRADSFLLSKNAFLVIFLHFYLIVMKNNDCKEFIINLAGIAKSSGKKTATNRNDQMRKYNITSEVYHKLVLSTLCRSNRCFSFISLSHFVNDY